MRAWTGSEGVLRIARNELLRLSARHLTVQESERRRIAADLHDGLGQSLSLVRMAIDHVASLLSAGETNKAAECLDRLKRNVEDTTEELRRIAANLRPAMLDSLGILDTLSWYFREVEASCPKVTIAREIRVNETDIPKHLRTPMFRIVQEASGNAIKHSGADRITVGLSKRRGTLVLSIGDNGRGFDSGARAGRNARNGGLGLRSMRERAELSRGMYELKSTQGSGTQIRVRWSYPPKKVGSERAAARGPRIRSLRDLTSAESEASHGSPIRGELRARVD